MKKIRLLDLGTVPRVRSQTCYHAAAQALGEETPDTIILVSPASPYVCIGFHQDLEKEVDLDYCRDHRLPVFRREVGGGAVYLDRNQIFVQWVFHPSSLPASIAERFHLYIEPLVLTYRALGIDARHRPVNDIHVGHKKIGGTGAARIGQAEVVVGSLMFDFDRATMAKVLRVTSEKMRDKVHQSLEQYMTTLRDELGAPPDRSAVVASYLDQCAKVLGADIVPGEWMAEEEALARELDLRFESWEWLNQKGAGKRSGIKIHEDVQVHESSLKAPGGLIHMTVRLRGGRIDDISISGDFTIFPQEAVQRIEQALHGILPDGRSVLNILEEQYRTLAIQSPGIEPEHWAEAVSLAVKSTSPCLS
jgi:lipoate---protein ligase